MRTREEDDEQKPLPWYKDGLKFKCTECGKCCTGQPGFVFVSEEEIHRMAQELRISLDLFKKKFLKRRNNRYCLVEKKEPDGSFSCIFLKDRKCEAYLARPSQCRTFPWWKENLNTKESWSLAAQDCEGISDEAPLVPYSQIVEALNKKE